MIKTLVTITIIVLSTFTLQAKDRFTGTWCIGTDRLVIEFPGGDVIKISSRGENAMSGEGTFTSTDSTFTATLSNEDSLTLEIGYLYRFRNAQNLRAKIKYLKVDGAEIDHDYPKKWLRMQVCDPDSFDFDAASKEDLIED